MLIYSTLNKFFLNMQDQFSDKKPVCSSKLPSKYFHKFNEDPEKKYMFTFINKKLN